MTVLTLGGSLRLQFIQNVKKNNKSLQAIQWLCQSRGVLMVSFILQTICDMQKLCARDCKRRREEEVCSNSYKMILLFDAYHLAP